MKVLSALVLCLISLKFVSSHSSKRAIVFQSVRKCAKESGLDYTTISKYLKGDFTNETKEAKVKIVQ